VTLKGKPMTDYRRIYIPGATWFFTMNRAKHRSNHLLIEKIEPLRTAFRHAKEQRLFHVSAVWSVVLAGSKSAFTTSMWICRAPKVDVLGNRK
jgi:hypothetical protein